MEPLPLVFVRGEILRGGGGGTRRWKYEDVEERRRARKIGISDRAAVVVAPREIRMTPLCILIGNNSDINFHPIHFLGLAASAAAVPTNSSLKEPRALFSVVQFPNDACTASNGLIGTCLTSTECTSR